MTDQITAAVGEDGIKIAMDALKEVAAGAGTPSERTEAARLLLYYGNVTFDSFGNEQRR